MWPHFLLQSINNYNTEHGTSDLLIHLYLMGTLYGAIVISFYIRKLH